MSTTETKLTPKPYVDGVDTDPHGYKRTIIGVIPEEWEAVPLGDLFTFKNGLNKAKRFFGFGTPIVNYMDVFGRPGLRVDDLMGRVSLSPQEIKNFEVRKGDVFFTRTSETVEEIGVASVMLDDPRDTVFSGFVLRARPRKNSLEDCYKKYCFAPQVVRVQIISKSTYTTRALTNGRSLSAVSIAVPPKPEQRAIAEALSDVDVLIGALEKLIAKKRAIKQAAMQQLITGKIRLPGCEKKNGCKRTEVGVIPEDWDVIAVGDLFQFLRTASNSRADLGESGDAAYVHYGDIHTRWTHILDFAVVDLPRILLSKTGAAARLQEGDLIVADASEDEVGVGKSVEVRNLDKDVAVSGLHTILLRSKNNRLHDGYRGYLHEIPSYKTQLRRVATGLKVFGISKRALKDVLVSIPPLPEQRAIATVLCDMDAEVAALERRRDKTKQIKQGMMQSLLTGRVRLVNAPEAEAKT